jgi:DNA replication and repair protein RecF
LSRKDKGKKGIYLINAILYLAAFQKRLLRLNSISLVQFKNYLHRSFDFHSRIVGISGPNGIGKTNLLDAIYYLCFTKSYFSRSDALSVATGSQGFRLEGKFDRQEQAFDILCILRENGRKEFFLDGEAYEKFARHVGRFPCVFIAPDDVRIITEGSEERRRFIDAIISQLDAEYLQRLMNYNKLLLQRNSYLKSLAETRIPDQKLLDVYDSQLVADGNYIFDRRKHFLEAGFRMVKEFYRKISGSEELIALEYESQLLKAPFAEMLAGLRERDIAIQRTSAGIHKDDILLLLNGQPFKSIASQGQRKSLLFALKLAEFTLLKENKGFSPLLLMDDVFEKLDENRMHNLLDWVCVRNEGQIFLTDTHDSRIAAHFEKLGVKFQLVHL